MTKQCVECWAPFTPSRYYHRLCWEWYYSTGSLAEILWRDEKRSRFSPPLVPFDRGPASGRPDGGGDASHG